MILVKLNGGLGNQLFQYAAGRSLAIRHGVELVIDTSAFKDLNGNGEDIFRPFGLQHFSPVARIANAADLTPFQRSKWSKAFDLLCISLGITRKGMYFREPYFHYFKNWKKLPDGVYLDGYWQSEKYFETIRSFLLKELSMPNSLSVATVDTAQNIRSSNSVSIHVRRGDYLSIPKNKELYAVCGIEYYNQAIQQVKSFVNDPVFFVFSDDPNWCRENLKLQDLVVVVDHNVGDNSYQDLYLMSLCKHNIIANSSFSWWGAWLNDHPEKKVFAPKVWFNHATKDTNDLIPSTWIKL